MVFLIPYSPQIRSLFGKSDQKSGIRFCGCRIFHSVVGIRIMSAHATGHVHEPVQTLANTLISFFRPRKGKRNAREASRLRQIIAPERLCFFAGGCSHDKKPTGHFPRGYRSGWKRLVGNVKKLF